MKRSAESDKKIEELLKELTLEEKVAMCHGNSKFNSEGCKRLNIGELSMMDGPHGVRSEPMRDEWTCLNREEDRCTYLPTESALAATFNPSLARKFYEMGFNIEATIGTAEFLKEHGIRTRIRRKLSEGSEEVLDTLRAGYVSYMINTRAILSGVHYEDGVAIRRCAIENNVTTFTSLDTVKVLLDVLEEQSIPVAEIF